MASTRRSSTNATPAPGNAPPGTGWSASGTPGILGGQDFETIAGKLSDPLLSTLSSH